MADDTDDALVERLRALAAAADAPPEHVEEAARAALETRTLDDLARLLTAPTPDEAVLTRADPGGVRFLAFASDDVVLDLQVDAEGGVATVRGLVHGAAGPVTLEVHGGASVSAEVDEAGYFTVTGLPAGAPAARVRAGGTTTEWFAL